MSKFVRAGTALALAGALVVAAGGVAAAKTVSDAKYAKVLCAALKAHQAAEVKAASTYSASDTSNPVAFQTSAAATFDGLIAQIQTIQKNLKKVSPQDGGKGVTKIFDAFFKEITTKLSDAVTKFKAADATGVAFAADVSTLNVTLQTLDIGLTDPFAKVKSQSMLGAFKDEKSCSKFVTIFGG